jgi:glycosyltransferase involved in cell wall biosynthesis
MENPKTKWYHWIHSYPFVQRDWFDMAHYTGDHYIVYPTIQDIKYIGEIFNTNKVISVPHILDCKSIYRLSDQAKVLVDLIPSIQTADIVQCYPASSDRLNSKGTRELVNLFGLLKKSGRSICLIIVNQFSGRRDSALVDPVYYYEKVARRCGLEPYVDFIFTSELLNGKYAEGMPQRTLFELMSFANLFVMPSKSESFGLGLLEAMMASGVICVANEHLNLPIKQHTSFDFKAINAVDQNISMNEMSPLVDWIIEQLENNAVVKARTVIRQQFNPLFIYNNYYKPLLASVPCVSESPLLPKSFENLEF